MKIKNSKMTKLRKKMRWLRIYFYKNELLQKDYSFNEWLIVELKRQ
jgi:hypothetical protein